MLWTDDVPTKRLLLNQNIPDAFLGWNLMLEQYEGRKIGHSNWTRRILETEQQNFINQ